ncbi:maltose O-acetyltransferase [Chryseobacterium ginsenosidimutans]|uniref:acyltransferase n=1 Tax=Chryseobacterium ginsenosidimutans TaxID=687846 RepID=UPI00278AE2A5|nr:acyltransferase [Chryseobacterium ginsenosidimutans]MDQ0595114.1 maltose O-acetyltransferase [Chryseobacterium ginsenosidimutans]
MKLLSLLHKNRNNVKKIFYLFLYKLIFKHLPMSTNMLFGNLSKKCRYYCCKNIFKECGKNVNIEKGADFGSGFEVIIGDNSGIGVNCRVPSNIQIGKNVMMGPECYILDANHKFDSIEIPMMFQGHLEKLQTIIEDDVWIGREALFTPGRIIKIGSIVGARTVLTKDFPSYSIVGGNPSRLIRTRNETKL